MKTLLVDITNQCNLRCIHCYNSRYFNTNIESFDIHQFTKTIDIISRNNGINRIHLLGGEPLISSHLFEILDICSHSCNYISINTNGVLLTKKMILKLSSYNKIDQITISLDGGNHLKNDYIRGDETFFTVKRNLEKNYSLLHKHFKINIACVLTENNISSIAEFSKLANTVGIDYFLFSFLYKQGNAVNMHSSINVFNLLFELGKLANAIGENKLILDIPPLAIDWLNILLGNDNKPEYNLLPNCGKDIIYYSSFNKTYICSPSSFYNDKYEITLQDEFYLEQKKCTKICNHNNACHLCPIDLSHEGFYMCDQILDAIDFIYKKIKDKQIIKSPHYSIELHNNHLTLLNYQNFTKITLIENYESDIISYNLNEITSTINDPIRLFEFKSKICALYYFKKLLFS